MKDAGLHRGCYHYARPSGVTPAASVALLAEQIALVGGLEVGDLVALDLEDTDVPATENLCAWTLEWLELAHRRFGVRPFVYSGTWYLEPHGLDDDRLAAWPLWLAAYQTTPPPAPAPWETVHLWQHSSRGAVNGVGGDCDLNRFHGTIEELAQLGYQASAPPDSLSALQDRTWAACEALQALADEWTGLGWPSTAIGLGSAAEAAKSLVRASKNEQ
jgi:GH25 family lysozyme M1 (1,4-beta-N-acetylmuramidase)